MSPFNCTIGHLRDQFNQETVLKVLAVLTVIVSRDLSLLYNLDKKIPINLRISLERINQVKVTLFATYKCATEPFTMLYELFLHSNKNGCA